MPGPNSMLEWMAGRNFVDDTTKKKKKKDKKKEPTPPPTNVAFGFATDDATQMDTVMFQYPRHGNPLRPKSFSSNISTNPDGSGIDIKSSLAGVGCSDDDEDAKSVITSKSKLTLKSAKSTRSSRAQESPEDPNPDCNCIDCVVGCRTLRRLGIEPRGKVRHDAPSSRKSRAVRSRKKSKKEDDSDATVVLSSDESDEQSPSPPRRSKSQRRAKQERGHERSSQSHSSSRSQASDNSSYRSSASLRDTPPANIMPPQPRRVQMEHTIENPNSDPRPNAYVDSQRNHVRVYHGPHWGSVYGTSHQHPHAAYPAPAPSPTYGQPVMGYSPTPHGHHQPYQHGACPHPCCARPYREDFHQHPVTTGQLPRSSLGSPSHNPRYPYSPQEPWRYNTGPPRPPVATSPGLPYRTHASPGYPVAPPVTVAGMGTTTGIEAASRRYSTRSINSPETSSQYTAHDVERILEEYNRKQREQGSQKTSENKTSENKTSRRELDDSVQSVSERYWAEKEKEEQSAARSTGKRNPSGNDNRGNKSRGSSGDNNESSGSAWDNVASGADSSNPGEPAGKEKQDSSQKNNESGGPSKGSPSNSQNANKNKKGDKKSNNADNGNDKASPNPGKDNGDQNQNPKNKKGNDKNPSESSKGGDKQKSEAAKDNNDKQSPNGGKGGGKGKKGEGKNKDGNKGSPKESDNVSEEKADQGGAPDTTEDTGANSLDWDPFNTTADETPSGDMVGTANATTEATTDDTPNGGAWDLFNTTADETPNGTDDSPANGGAWDAVQDDSQTQSGSKNGNGKDKKKKNKGGRQSNASSSGDNTDSGNKTDEWGGTEEKKDGNDNAGNDSWGTSNDNDNSFIASWGDLPTDNGDSAGQGKAPEYDSRASRCHLCSEHLLTNPLDLAGSSSWETQPSADEEPVPEWPAIEPESELEKPATPHELPTSPKQRSPEKESKKKEKQKKKDDENDSESSTKQPSPTPLTSLFTGWVANTINNVVGLDRPASLLGLPGAWVSVVDGGSDNGDDEKKEEEENNGGTWTPNPTPANEHEWGSGWE